MALAQQSAIVANCLFTGTVENSSVNVGVNVIAGNFAAANEIKSRLSRIEGLAR
jgi:hypothetical protein